jgi:Flp pilus assembly CpaF family ATPase
VEIPYAAIKANIADSLNIIVQIERRPGRRHVSEVLEIRAYNSGADHYDLCPKYKRSDHPSDACVFASDCMSA